MARYTIELGRIADSKNVEIFDFPYNFYDESHKKDFEEKFIETYYFHEIGFETIGRFKKFLQAKLNLKMSYYTQLYKTELRTKEIDFMLNKDLKETFVKEIVKEGHENTEHESNNINNGVTTVGDMSIYKESNLQNGLADLTQDKLTTITETDTNNNINSNNQGTTTGTNNKITQDIESEKTEFISQGNIGVTSASELLKKWRDVIINIDEMIIEECEDLFMKIY